MNKWCTHKGAKTQAWPVFLFFFLLQVLYGHSYTYSRMSKHTLKPKNSSLSVQYSSSTSWGERSRIAEEETVKEQRKRDEWAVSKYFTSDDVFQLWHLQKFPKKKAPGIKISEKWQRESPQHISTILSKIFADSFTFSLADATERDNIPDASWHRLPPLH